MTDTELLIAVCFRVVELWGPLILMMSPVLLPLAWFTLRPPTLKNRRVPARARASRSTLR